MQDKRQEKIALKITPSAQLQNEVTSLPLQSKGVIPRWLCGTLIRNGPIYVTVDGKTNPHWFDGLAMLHAFSFHEGQVQYTNKFLRTDAYQSVFEKGSLNYIGFASDPCRSLFKQFLTFFLPKTKTPLHNANVNVAKIADQYVALTEIPLPISFDKETLETLGVLDYQDHLPHEKCWESAHPHNDRTCQETINYLIKYGYKSQYILYRIKNDSSVREVIAQIPVQEPSYMHSFSLTENYVIFTEYPFVVKPLDLILQRHAFIKNFSWHPERGTQFTIVNRHSGEVVKKYITKSFFSFHHANAFEKENHIYVDIVCYDDPSVVMKVATQYKPQVEKENRVANLPVEKLKRFSFSLQTQEITSETIFEGSCEFPRINECFDGKPYRYVYLSDPGEIKLENSVLRAIYKVDMETKKVCQWQELGCCPGEPVFIATPGTTQEDDGILLTVVNNVAQHRSFLLVLDAKNLTELGRSEVTHMIPNGLHGQYFPEVSKQRD